MSCCGNNNIQNLNKIYSQVSNPTPSPGPFRSLVGKGSPFNNYSLDYKPILTANGKFVKYTRQIKEQK